MVNRETANSPRHKRTPRLNFRSNAVNRIAMTCSSISIAIATSKSEEFWRAHIVRLEPQGIPAPLPKVGSSAGRVFNFKT